MAPSSQTMQNRIQSCDRFSDLPNEVIHQIFSFLGENDTARISLLSRRFRQLWVTSPYLSFKTTCHHSHRGRCSDNCVQFSNFLDRLMSLQNGMEITSPCLHWNCYALRCEEGSLLDKWIHNAVKCMVQELDFRLDRSYGGGVFVLPHCVCNCQSLRVLILNLGSANLELPSAAFPSLEVLSLEGVRVVNFSLGEWISTSCMTLKKLTLSDAEGFVNLSITNSLLEDFIFCNSRRDSKILHINMSTERLLRLSLHMGGHPYEKHSIKIFAPNLQLLKWQGDIVYDSYFENLISVQEATINVKRPYQAEDSARDFIFNLLGKLSSARILHLKDWIIEILVIQGCVPDFFYNVHHLVVATSSLRDINMSAIATFLMDFVNMKTFVIKFDKHSEKANLDESKSKHKSGKSQNPILMHQLKEVEIEFTGENNDTGLVEYLLKNAKGLEKMTIYYSSSYLYMLSDIGVENLERASPTAEVFLLPEEFFEGSLDRPSCCSFFYDDDDYL